VQKIDPPLTPAQLKAKADEDERQRALAKAKDEQARKDMALIQSYSNEDEIDIARKRAISTVEAQINSAQAYTADLTRQQKNIANQKATFGSKPILLRQKQEELAMVATKYDSIKQRWREIMADEARAAAAADAQAAAKAAKGGSGKPATATPPAAPTTATK